MTKPRFRLMSKEEKRQEVISGSGGERKKPTLIHNAVCPLCRMFRSLKKKEDTPLSYDKFDVNNDNFIIEIATGGRGSGFYPTGKGMTLKQVKESGEYDELLEQIKEQCKRILKVLG